MLGDALEFPRNADDWLQTVLIGGILSALQFLVVPVFVVQGYSVRVLRNAATGTERPPSFTDWGDLIVDGLKLIVVELVYAFVVLLPILVVVAVSGAAFVGGRGGLLAGLVGVVGVLVAVVLALVAAYVLPAALANFAVEDSMAAAFDLSTVLAIAFTGDYAVAWVVAVVVGLVGGLVGGALTALVVGVFVLFYVQVVVFYLFGRGAGVAMGRRA